MLQPGSFVIAVFEFVLLIFSLSVHECAHAWMASRLGDQTARLQGRVTLNPMYHVDPFGTLLFPALMIFGPLLSGGAMGGFLFGWAKPTPVITRNFKKIVRDDTITTLAGPVSNLLLAFLGFLGLAVIILVQGHLPSSQSMGTNVEALGILCELAINVNLALFFFNLLPLPPLDGSRILRHFLPYNALNAYDRMGILSFVLMIFLGGPIVRFLMGPTLGLVRMALRSL
ncbi:MAG TPA: site-2 protease family protein [Terracidiphilus sp.]|jgi:Zn-dependent protease